MFTSVVIIAKTPPGRLLADAFGAIYSLFISQRREGAKDAKLLFVSMACFCQEKTEEKEAEGEERVVVR